MSFSEIDATNNLPEAFNEAQKSFLYANTPKQYIKQRKARGGDTIDYVKVGYVIRQLNLIFGHLWDFEILSETIMDDEVIVKGKLSIKNQKGDIVITKMQYGSSDVKKYRETKRALSVGDDLKAAASDSLKKCASLIGIALDVYTGESFGNNSSDNDSWIRSLLVWS